MTKNNKNKRSVFEGYKRYRAPGVFGGKKITEENESKNSALLTKISVYALLVLVLVFIVFKSSFFNIKEVMVEGNQNIPEEEVAAYAPKGENIFLYNIKIVKTKIFAEHPEIKDVMIYRGIPNAIKIVILEEDAKLVWQTGIDRYLLSSEGKISKKLVAGESVDYPTVIDKKNIAVKSGDYIVSPSFVAFVNNIKSQCLEATNLKPDHFEVNETTFDVYMYTDSGIYVKFNSARNSGKQLENLKLVLVQKKDQIKEYVDLRIDGWAYYK